MASESNRKFARLERQLFLDDADIDSVDGLKMTMHQPNKKGAVIRSDPFMALRAGRDDGPAYRPQTRTAPVWDAEAELWKFWTIGAKMDADNGRSSYHESRDGLHWYQPNVGQFDYQGSRDNNHVAIPIDDKRTSEVLGVVYDARDPDPSAASRRSASSWFPTIRLSLPCRLTALSGGGMTRPQSSPAMSRILALTRPTTASLLPSKYGATTDVRTH